MAQKVVAHFTDHRIIKGTSVDVDPGKPHCHVQSPEHGNLEIDLTELKALYFVKDYAGRPDHDEARQPAEGDTRVRGSHRVKLTFLDGEVLYGLMNRYPPNRPFFYVLPVDADSNNLRMLVNRKAVGTIESLEPTGSQPETPSPRWRSS